MKPGGSWNATLTLKQGATYPFLKQQKRTLRVTVGLFRPCSAGSVFTSVPGSV